jgi:hypothetical protein
MTTQTSKWKCTSQQKLSWVRHICITRIDANTVDIRVAIVFRQALYLWDPSAFSLKSSSNALSWSVVKPCTQSQNYITTLNLPVQVVHYQKPVGYSDIQVCLYIILQSSVAFVTSYVKICKNENLKKKRRWASKDQARDSFQKKRWGSNSSQYTIILIYPARIWIRPFFLLLWPKLSKYATSILTSNQS